MLNNPSLMSKSQNINHRNFLNKDIKSYIKKPCEPSILGEELVMISSSDDHSMISKGYQTAKVSSNVFADNYQFYSAQHKPINSNMNITRHLLKTKGVSSKFQSIEGWKLHNTVARRFSSQVQILVSKSPKHQKFATAAQSPMRSSLPYGNNTPEAKTRFQSVERLHQHKKLYDTHLKLPAINSSKFKPLHARGSIDQSLFVYSDRYNQ